MILLPWDARNTICLALIGYFSQNMGLVPGRSWFCNFLYSSNQFQTFFENISKTVGSLEKAINTHFVWNLSSFQENFKFCKLVVFQELLLKILRLIFLHHSLPVGTWFLCLVFVLRGQWLCSFTLWEEKKVFIKRREKEIFGSSILA